MPALPQPLPTDPLPLVRSWLVEAEAGDRRNPAAMALATANASGQPAVRMVLLKSISVEHGFAVFYSNYESRKGRELEARPRAAATLYWEELGRQLRFEGPVTRSPADESDAYFATRPFASQVNAWVSAQSRDLGAFAELEQRAAAKASELGGQTQAPRPPFWGGYRLWLEAVELWVEGADRFHERVRYERDLARSEAARFNGGAWRHRLLQP
jgi:pyridoxamine 5'-phosphate oxidase